METQEPVNEARWIFSSDFVLTSIEYVAAQEPEADVLVSMGMLNFRHANGLPLRMFSVVREIEGAFGKPIISTDCALYWNIFRAWGVAPMGDQPRLHESLQDKGA